MKNIWKLLLIAMMALAMVGCPQGGNNSDDDDDVPGAIQPYYTKVTPAISETGIYTYTLNETMIGSGFDSTNTFDTLKFILVPKTVADKIVNEEITDGAGLATKTNKVLAYANNTYGNGRIFKNSVGSDGYYAIWSSLKDAEGYEAAGVKKNGTGYDVIFDMNKAAAAVNKLLAFVVVGSDQPEVTEDDQEKLAQTGYKPSDIVSSLVANYVPCIIGSVCQNGYDDENNPFGIEYACNLWNSGVVPMAASTEEFPATLKTVTKELPPLPEGLNSVAGGINGWTHKAMTNGVYTFISPCAGDAEFKITEGNWDAPQLAGFDVTTDGVAVTVTADGLGKGNAKLHDLTLFATYKLTYTVAANKLSATVKVEKTADPPAFTAPVLKLVDSTDDADESADISASQTWDAWGSYDFVAEEGTKPGYTFLYFTDNKDGWKAYFDATDDAGRTKAIQDNGKTSIWLEPNKPTYILYKVWKED